MQKNTFLFLLKKYILPVFVLLLFIEAKAQKTQLLSENSAGFIYNPATINQTETYFGTFGMFKQWLTMPGAPLTAYFNGGLQIDKLGSFSISGINTRKGVLSDFSLQAQFARTFKIYNKADIRFGFGTGFAKKAIVTGKIKTTIADDALLSGVGYNQSSVLFASGVAANLGTWSAEAAMSELSFFDNQVSMSGKTALAYTYYFESGIGYLQPSLAYYYNPIAGNTIRFEVSSMLYKMLYTAISAGSNGDIALSLGINISNWNIRYANAVSVGNSPGYLGGTHEFAFSGGFTKSKPVIKKPKPEPIDSLLVVTNNSKDTTIVVENNIKPPAAKEKTRLLTGIITDKITGNPLSGIVEVIDNTTNKLIASTKSDSITGKYEIVVPLKKNIGVAVKLKDRMFHSENFSFDENDTTDFAIPEISLQPIAPGSKIILNNIFFIPGSATPTTESYSEFDRLYGLMNDYPDLRIQISGHTDNTGTVALNYKLSKERARVIVLYLIDKGINSDRFEYEGFADTQPIAENNTQEGRDKNRRVEAEIIE